MKLDIMKKSQRFFHPSNSLRIGVTSDLHGNLGKARKAASYFRKADVDAIVLAGDTPSDKHQRRNLIKILKIFLKTKNKIFIMPGSHEHYKDYYSTMKVFNKKIIDCTKNQIYQRLVFLPGADSTAPGAGFRILRDRRQLERFRKKTKELREHFWGKISTFYTSDLNNMLDKSSILIAHIPPEFKTKGAIDLATYGTPRKPFILKEKHGKHSKTTASSIMLPDYVVFGIDEAKNLQKHGYPVKIKTENVGNPYLKAVIKKKKVKFLICSHIHESGGKACNLKGKPIQQNTWSKELFYNCSGRAGIVEFLNNQARYRNVKL